MKDGRSGSKSVQPLASKAINFINEQLVKRSFNFKGMCLLKLGNFNQSEHAFLGQKVQDAISSKIPSSSADDSILNCCLQIREKGKLCVYKIRRANLQILVINLFIGIDFKRYKFAKQNHHKWITSI